jgi:hypothetical protein
MPSVCELKIAKFIYVYHLHFIHKTYKEWPSLVSSTLAGPFRLLLEVESYMNLNFVTWRKQLVQVYQYD